MSRWMLYRQRYHRKRNAFLLLTLSGAIRSADVEISFLPDRKCSASQNRARTTTDPLAQSKPSIWSMHVWQLFSKHT
jgi:hypothetical protein